jgi:hypothetical protein
MGLKVAGYQVPGKQEQRARVLTGVNQTVFNNYLRLALYDMVLLIRHLFIGGTAAVGKDTGLVWYVSGLSASLLLTPYQEK